MGTYLCVASWSGYLSETVYLVLSTSISHILAFGSPHLDRVVERTRPHFFVCYYKKLCHRSCVQMDFLQKRGRLREALESVQEYFRAQAVIVPWRPRSGTFHRQLRSTRDHSEKPCT